MHKNSQVIANLGMGWQVAGYSFAGVLLSWRPWSLRGHPQRRRSAARKQRSSSVKRDGDGA